MRRAKYSIEEDTSLNMAKALLMHNDSGDDSLFLEEKIRREKEVKAASAKVPRDTIEKILESCEAANWEELIQKKGLFWDGEEDAEEDWAGLLRLGLWLIFKNNSNVNIHITH